MKTNLISKSETSDILKLISKKWKLEIPRVKNLKSHYVDNDSQILVGENFKILKLKDEFIPFLSDVTLLESFPSVTVDMGAVKFMCKGANVMRPGIKKYTEFSKGDVVCIVEESQHKFLAVGKAVTDSSELDDMKKGEVIKNLHYVSDKCWEFAKMI